MQHASTWWEQDKRSREREGKLKILDWKKMQKSEEAILTYNYTQIIYQRLHTFSQGRRSVNDYTEDFYKLVARNDLAESKEQLVEWHIGGLHPSIEAVLSVQLLWYVSEAY